MIIPDVRLFLHDSQVLIRNPMGDPTRRKLPIFVPPGYSESRKEPYPVVFMLAGWSGRGAGFLNDAGVFGSNLADSLAAGMSREEDKAIVVFPDGSTKFGASQYVNSAANGRYMDYICDELVGFVDQKFHTHKSPAYRGVLGHSSGGFGALVFGMLRPDRFSCIMSSAGDAWYEYLYVHSIPQTVSVIRRAGSVAAFLERWLESPNPRGLLGRADEAAMLNLSMCPCYAPNLQAPPLLGDLYFDLETGEIVPEVFAKFLEWDPVRMVDTHQDALRQLRYIHLESGIEDEYGLCLGHRQLSAKLKNLGIAHTVEEYPGRHTGHHHRMTTRIQRMVLAMRKRSPGS